MASYPFRSWAEISRGQLAENFRCVRSVVGPSVEVMPVVKADAYRHGAVEVSRTLAGAGARWLAVSNAEEGIQLRQAGIETRILVMGDFLPFERNAFFEHGLTPVVHSLEDLAAFDELARRHNAAPAYHLKIDSGMGRLGTRAPFEQVCAAIQAARHARLEGLMTHFASAADYTSSQTDQQTDYFLRMCARLEAAGVRPEFVHLSSTTPIAYGRKAAWKTMVRPGHAIYGYVSPARGAAPPNLLRVKPVLTWKASVLSIKEVPPGAPIGYGGIFRAPRPMRIAVLAAGYADGVPHRLSNRGKVIVCGKPAPIVGAVSMDLTTIDVTHCPALQVGDAVTLLGREGDAQIDAQQMARWAGTISYSVLCGISSRVKRVYVD
jgi:alanine racemase